MMDILSAEEKKRKSLMEQAMRSDEDPQGFNPQAMQSRGLGGQLLARLGVGEPLTDFEKESTARARAMGLGFGGTGLGAVKYMQFSMDDQAKEEAEEAERQRVEDLLAGSNAQANLLRAQNDRYSKTGTGMFDRLTGEFLTNEDFIALRARELAQEGQGGNEIVGAEQYTDNRGNIYSVSTSKNGGAPIVRDMMGNQVTELPSGFTPISDAGIADANKRSVEAFNDFSKRSLEASSTIAKNEDTIRRIEKTAGAFGSSASDWLGRTMVQLLGTEYAGMSQEEYSTLAARFAESQLQTVQRYLAGTGPVTEAEQAIAARFSGSFEMAPDSVKQLFQLQNYLARKDQKMRQDWMNSGLPEREFSRWRNKWVQENEDLSELETIFSPDSSQPSDDLFNKADAILGLGNNSD